MSRRSFLATEPPDPRRFLKDSLKGSLKGFQRVRVPVSAEEPFKNPSKRLQKPFWESAKVSHKRVFALLTPEIHSYEVAQMLQKPVFALPGCQRTSVNTLSCDTLALADL